MTEITTATNPKGRPRKNFEQMAARFGEGTFALVDAVLADGETRADFVREAVDAAIEGRARKPRVAQMNGKTTDDRIARAVALLGYVAERKTVISYGQFAGIIGGSMIARSVGKFLTDEVAPYIRANKLPPLWAVCINAKTGRSSDPDTTLDDLGACYRC